VRTVADAGRMRATKDKGRRQFFAPEIRLDPFRVSLKMTTLLHQYPGLFGIASEVRYGNANLAFAYTPDLLDLIEA